MPVLAQERQVGLPRISVYSSAPHGCPIKSRIERSAYAHVEKTFFRSLADFAAKPVRSLAESLLNHAFASSPWVAGKTAYDAVERARSMLLSLPRGSNVILCSLGEHTTSKEEADAAVAENMHLIDVASGQIGALAKEKGVTPSIAIRPSSFGTEISLPGFEPEKYCFENMEAVVAHAKEKGIFVWLDMESHEYHDYTIDVYEHLQEKYGNVGLALQANVHRSMQDMLNLLNSRKLQENLPVFRLCKGIYEEMKPHGTEDYGSIHGNYQKMIQTLFARGKDGVHVVVATHHEGRVLDALQGKLLYPGKTVELQMLMGVKSSLAKKLNEHGIPVTIYVPYGPKTAPYCIRRFLRSPDFAQMTMAAWVGELPPLLRSVVRPKMIMAGYKLITAHDAKPRVARGSEADANMLWEYISEHNSTIRIDGGPQVRTIAP